MRFWNLFEALCMGYMVVVVTINSIEESVMGFSIGASVCGSSGASVMISSSISTDSTVEMIGGERQNQNSC